MARWNSSIGTPLALFGVFIVFGCSEDPGFPEPCPVPIIAGPFVTAEMRKAQRGKAATDVVMTPSTASSYVRNPTRATRWNAALSDSPGGAGLCSKHCCEKRQRLRYLYLPSR